MRTSMVILTIAVAWITERSDTLPANLKPVVEAKAKGIVAMGIDRQVVAAVRSYNAAPPAGALSMTNEKWRSLSIRDPFVRSFSRGSLVDRLRKLADPAISKLFISGRNGCKVAFFEKPISWDHSDQDKHQVPMTGKIWYGPLEIDPSTGQEAVQVGFPVLDGGH